MVRYRLSYKNLKNEKKLLCRSIADNPLVRNMPFMDIHVNALGSRMSDVFDDVVNDVSVELVSLYKLKTKRQRLKSLRCCYNQIHPD